MLHKVAALFLFVCLVVTSVHAQTDLVANDFVLVIVPRLSVYTQPTSSGTVTVELLRGTRSRILELTEDDNGTVWAYLETNAYGWVPTTLGGVSTMTLYSRAALSQMLERANEAVEIKPDEPESYVWRGTIYLTLNHDLTLAIDDYSTALELSPEDPALLEYRGKAYLNYGDFSAAAADFEDAIYLGTVFASTYNRAGIAYEGLGAYELAIEFMEQGLVIAPDYGILTGNIGTEYYYLGDMDRSEDYWEQALEIDSHLTYHYADIGNNYYESGDYERALDLYNTGIDVDPLCYACFISRGSFYAEYYGDYDSAIEDFVTATRINPYDERGFGALGMIHMNMGEFDEAINDFKTAANLNPRNDFIFYNLGTVYAYQGEYEKALETYSHVVEIAGDWSYAVLFERAQIYVALGDYDNAIEDAEAYISIYSEVPEELYYITTAHLTVAAAYVYSEDYDSAERGLDDALDTQSDFVINYSYYGQGYWITGLRLEDAFELGFQFNSDPQNTDLALQAANLYFEFGYWEDALFYYQEYEDLVSRTPDGFDDFIQALEDLTR